MLFTDDNFREQLKLVFEEVIMLSFETGLGTCRNLFEKEKWEGSYLKESKKELVE